MKMMNIKKQTNLFLLRKMTNFFIKYFLFEYTILKININKIKV